MSDTTTTAPGLDVPWGALFKGSYITAAELDGKTATMTISHVLMEKLTDPETGKEKDKGIVYFREIPRGWVANRTNMACVAAMFGDRTGAWTGKRVTLFSTPVNVGPKKELGIRVKGSPDIEAPIQVVVKLPRRKPITMTMEPTRRLGTPAREPGEEG